MTSEIRLKMWNHYEEAKNNFRNSFVDEKENPFKAYIRIKNELQEQLRGETIKATKPGEFTELGNYLHTLISFFNEDVLGLMTMYSGYGEFYPLFEVKFRED